MMKKELAENILDQPLGVNLRAMENAVVVAGTIDDVDEKARVIKELLRVAGEIEDVPILLLVTAVLWSAGNERAPDRQSCISMIANWWCTLVKARLALDKLSIYQGEQPTFNNVD
jgi:hypothetical protein